MKDYLVVSEEVKQALADNKPVVALESTIISHGMPYPKNVETALRVEEIIRENGAVPATIAIIKGKLVVGVSKEEIDYLGKKGLAVAKVSRRDIPVIVARGEDGATTVATTMIIANLAGVKVFATGGIGGVHRGAETTMDISADLEELANTNVAVVCAGCKSILDIGLTLEYLETKGVPVVGYQTEEFPAFYTQESGFKVDYKMDSPLDIAKALKSKYALGLNGSIVISNPIPDEHAMDKALIEDVIVKAVKDADSEGVKGKDITPYLLDKIQRVTEGQSLEANIQLVYNNAKLGALVAKEYAGLQ